MSDICGCQSHWYKHILPVVTDICCARRFGEYELHDLVELDQQTAGVLVQADAETCQVLTNRNAVSTSDHCS